MSHYIIPGGLFKRVFSALLSDGFRLACGEIVEDLDDNGDDKGGEKGKTTRVKFTCQQCGANAWGKATLKLICGTCLAAMVAE